MKNNKFLPMVFALFALMFTACDQEENGSFEALPAVNFVDDAAEYSFLGNPEEFHLHEAEVRIIGEAVDYDRHFEVEVVQDEFTTASTAQYEILEGVVPAGEYSGKLSIRLLKSPELDNKKVSLHLKLVASEDFKTGNIETDDYVVAWTNQVVVPAWRWYSFFFTRTASTAAYRAVVESTGLVKFEISDYLALGPVGAEALGTKFGDYVKQYNLDHPGAPLLHDDGPGAGTPIVPLYYTRSKYD